MSHALSSSDQPAAGMDTMASNGQRHARLSRLLVVEPRHLDEAFWTDPSTVRFRSILDLCGLISSFFSLVMLHRVLMLYSRSSTKAGWRGLFQVAKGPVYMLCSLLQVFMFGLGSQKYMKWRNTITLVNRMVGILGNTIHLLILKPEEYVALFPVQGKPGVALFGLLSRISMVNLQMSINYSLPFALALPMQLLSVFPTGIASRLVMCGFQNGTVPLEVQQLVPVTCFGINTVIECISWSLFKVLTIDLSFLALQPMPFSSSGHIHGVCNSPAAASLMIVYADLMLCPFIPILATFVLEYTQKRQFLKARGIEVVAAWSPLLLLPNHAEVSYLTALLVVPMLLWWLSAVVAPYLVPLHC